MGQYLFKWQKQWLRGHKKGHSTGKFDHSPLYESVGLISIKLSSPPFPVIRCIVSPSCVQASLNGPPIHQSVPSRTLFGPVSHAGTPVRLPLESSSRETPQLTDQASWQASLLPPRTADCRITSARSGGRCRTEEWPHTTRQWLSSPGEADTEPGCLRFRACDTAKIQRESPNAQLLLAKQRLTLG